MMWKRVIVIGSATGLAAVVLFLALMAEPTSPPPERSRIDDPIGADSFTSIGSEGSGGRSSARGQADQYHVRRHTSSGQLIELFGDSLSPEANGVSRVVRPGARIHLAPNKVIELRAEEGTFVAPDNEPRRGDFVGRVVLTLFESPAERPSRAGTDAGDVKLRLFLDDARFDLELGLIESDRAVHMVGPNVDFRGEGLALNYNERRNRIDRLLIPRGRSLRFRHVASRDSAVESVPKKSQPRHVDMDTAIVESDDSNSPGQTQFYRARISRRVTVRSPEAVVEADSLDIVFSLDAQQDQTNAPRHAGARLPDKDKQGPAQEASPAGLDTDELPQPHAMAQVTADDVVVTWSGPLLVEPEDSPPLDLTGPDHVLLELVGRPARISSDGQLTAEASRVDYLSSTGRLRLMGSDNEKLTITGPQIGRLAGQNLVVWASDGTGQMTGPGSVVLSRGLSVEQGERSGGELTTVAWQDQLDLIFFREGPSLNTESSPDAVPTTRSRLAGLKEAIFRGEVRVEEDRFQLVSDRLSISMSAPRDTHQRIETIRADEGARLMVRDTSTMSTQTTEPMLDLAAREVSLDLASSDEAEVSSPMQLQARGDVVAKQPGYALRSGVLIARIDAAADHTGTLLTQPVVDGTGASEHEPENEGAIDGLPQRFRLTGIQASEHVRIEMDLANISVAADRCEANGLTGIFEMYGKEGDPAQASWREGRLTGDRIVMDRQKQQVRVPGAGRFTYSTTDNGVDMTSTKLNVTWLDGMSFDNVGGSAQFSGSVVARAEMGLETSRLEADEVRLELDRPGPQDSSGSERSTAGVRAVVAEGSAVLVGEQWSDRPGETLATRLRASGPALNMDQAEGRFEVLGPGTLLYEDYHAVAPKSADRPASDSNEPSDLELTGRGLTLFTWKEKLSVDGHGGQLLMTNDVQALHEPLADGHRVQLDCNSIDAEIGVGSGLGPWDTNRPGPPRLKSVTARDGVRMLAGERTVYTDRLEYRVAEQQVLLSAHKNRQTRLYLEGETTVHSARQFMWDLGRDRIEITQSASGPVQLR